MPMDWSILTCDEDFADLEINPLASLNNRGFLSPILNPMHSWMPRAEEIQITNVYLGCKMVLSKLKTDSMLVVLEDGPSPMCYVCKRLQKNKNVDILDML